MSFLEALRDKQKGLKHADTVVTQADGRRFLESKSGIAPIADGEYGFVLDTKPDDIPGKITEYIYLGSQDCCEPSILNEHDITRVLSLGVAPSAIAPGVTYEFVECLDLPETDILLVVREQCAGFIRGAVADKQRVLIHCNAGVSRSSAVTIGFLMLENGWDYDVAYDAVKKARSCIRPNSGFARQLQTMVKEN